MDVNFVDSSEIVVSFTTNLYHTTILEFMFPFFLCVVLFGIHKIPTELNTISIQKSDFRLYLPSEIFQRHERNITTMPLSSIQISTTTRYGNRSMQVEWYCLFVEGLELGVSRVSYGIGSIYQAVPHYRRFLTALCTIDKEQIGKVIKGVKAFQERMDSFQKVYYTRNVKVFFY